MLTLSLVRVCQASDDAIQALELYRRGNCKEARPLLEQILAKQPKNAEIRRLLNNCSAPDAKRGLALEAARNAARKPQTAPTPVAKAPKRPPMANAPPPIPARTRPPTEREVAGERLEQAEQLIKAGRPAEAEKMLRVLVGAKPGLSLPRLRLAEIYSAAKRFTEAAAQYRSLAELPGASPDMRLRLANNLAWDKQFAEAAESYALYLANRPADVEARLGLANILFWSNRLREAVPAMRSYLELRPRDTAARLNLARALLWTKQYEEALTEFEKLRAASPKDALIELAIAQCYEQLDKPEAALASFQAVLSKAPGQKDAAAASVRLNRMLRDRTVLSLQQKGDFKAAAEVLLSYLERAPDGEEVTLQVARLYSWAKDTPKALSHYEAYLRRYPEDTTALRELARIQTSIPDLPGARRSLGSVISAGDGKVEDYEGLVNANVWEGHYEAARPFIDKLLELDAENETGKRASRLVFDKARSQELDRIQRIASSGKFSDALEAYRGFVQNFGADRETELAVARLHAWDNQAPKAEQAYLEYIHRYPQDKAARLELADIQRWNSRTQAAEKEYHELLKAEPGSAQARFGLAQIADQRGDDRFLVYRSYREVLALEPGNQVARERLSEIVPLISPSVGYRQQTFHDSDQFSRSLTTLEAGFPLRGGLRVIPLFRYGYFNQFREVGGTVCGSGRPSRATDGASRALSEQICSSRGNLRGAGGGLRLELAPSPSFLFTSDASALKLNTASPRWAPMIAAELVVRPTPRQRLTLGFRHREAVFDLNTISTLFAGIASDTAEASFEVPLNPRWNLWVSAGAARYSASRDRAFGDNFQKRVTARANYQLTPWITAGYYLRLSGFRRHSPLYFSPEFYGVSGMSWTWDHPLSKGLRFVGDIEIGYGRIIRYDTGAVNNLELSFYPSFVWSVRPDLALQFGYRFGRGRSSAFGSPVYGTGILDFGLTSYFTPPLPHPNVNRIEIR
jgi:thioredoxin-like negative regulator of GroEL